MDTITLSKITHDGQKRIKLGFPYNPELIELTKKISGARWSRSQKYWHIPQNFLKEALKVFEGKVQIDKTLISELPAEVITSLQKFQYWLHSKRYSESTIGTYTDALKTFLKFYDKKPIQEITNEDVIKFNNEFILKQKLSASYQNQVVNAIKLFFRTVQNRTINVDIIHRPKRPKLLPNVLSKEEVKLILNAPSNLKYKAMLSPIYSCGLRCSELLQVKPQHVDSRRGVLIIKQSKGRKDRIAPLSLKIIELLREYFIACQPKIYLFEGQTKGQPYDARSLQKVLKQSLKKVKINKPVSLHWLRHSYATHLLENGTD